MSGETTPRERPILFSGPMVRAILEGRKTQTRRVIIGNRRKLLPTLVHAVANVLTGKHWAEPGGWVSCPYGHPGDRLWVRETWGDGSAFYPHSPVLYGADEPADLGASCRNQAEADRAQGREHRVLEGCRCHFRWRPSIHMPRTASRLSLEVLSVRVERLQDISEEDACAEGVVPLQMDMGTYRPRFEGLWDSINGQRPGASWADNPWVWVVGFKRADAAAGRAA